MLERIRSRLIPPSSHHEFIRGDGITLVAADPLGLSRLDGVCLLDNKDSVFRPIVNDCNAIARRKVRGFKINRHNGDVDEFVVMGPPLNALETNLLLFGAAPLKNPFYKLDTRDVLNDWKNLYQGQEHSVRKRFHENMPGWHAFERSKDAIWQLLEEGYDNDSKTFALQDTTKTLVPVLHWSTDMGGRRTIHIDPLDNEVKRLLVASSDGSLDETQLNDGLGVLYLSTFTKESKQWPISKGYGHKGTLQYGQDMGPAQVLALTYRFLAEKQQGKHDRVPDDHDIQQSRILASLERHIITGAKVK